MKSNSIEYDILGGNSALFADRFLDNYAGSITNDPLIAVSELIANAWDAYATEVHIGWPDDSLMFEIRDNGEGIEPANFENRWKTLSYDRVKRQGKIVKHPDEPNKWKPRDVFGRHGKGRFAGFCFADEYSVRTWRDGEFGLFNVERGNPFSVIEIDSGEQQGHGLEIRASLVSPLTISAEMLRTYLSTRFLFDSDFRVTVNGQIVKFGDIPDASKVEETLKLPDGTKLRALVIDSHLPDKTTRQHGIVWWINGRTVGQPTWDWPDRRQILDGRTAIAKRYTIQLSTSFLASSVLPDWSGFDLSTDDWSQFSKIARPFIEEIVSNINLGARSEKRNAVIAASKDKVENLSIIEKGVWAETLDTISDECPNFSEVELSAVMNVLATMEDAKSQYSLLGKLEKLDAADIDQLDELLEKWDVSFAHRVLDEIEIRLRLISEIRKKSLNNKTDEVSELQPLIGDSLWVFGPEFESIEYTSNLGMTKVIKEIFGSDQKGSRNRPDFVIKTDSSIGLYSAPSFDDNFQENGVRRLVIVELKRPGLRVGDPEKQQVKKYVRELKDRGLIHDWQNIQCYILGSEFAKGEGLGEKYFNDQMHVHPMLYNTFVNEAERRMMNLRKKLTEGPLVDAMAKGREVDERLKELLL